MAQEKDQIKKGSKRIKDQKRIRIRKDSFLKSSISHYQKSRCKSVKLPNRNREEGLNMLSDEFSEAQEKSMYLRQYKCGSNSRGCGNTWWGAEANNKCRLV